MNYRNRFFKKKYEFLTLGQVLEVVGGRLYRETDLSRRVFDVATLQNGGQGELSFLSSSAYFRKFCESGAEFCLISEESAQKADRDDVVCVICEDPYFAYAQIAAVFYEDFSFEAVNGNVHPSARVGRGCVVAPTAYVGAGVELGDVCVIGSGAVIGDGCVLGEGVKVDANATVVCSVIGAGSRIYSGARIGQDGFGFAHFKGVNHKILQLGAVEIGRDVEIGANSCVDRGAIENTVIGDGVKIDNLVQIGHNVEIGQGAVIAGCSAVAGSAKIGRFVQIGGKSSISGHLEVGDGAKIAGMSGVAKNVAPMQAVAGIPAVNIRDWHRMNLKMMKLVKGKS